MILINGMMVRTFFMMPPGRDSVIMNYYHGKKNGIWIYLKDDRDTVEMRAFDKREKFLRDMKRKSGEWKITKASDIPFLERLR